MTGRPPAGLLDTSVFIAAESGRSLNAEMLPLQGSVSVITASELEAGIHAASTSNVRSARLQTYQALATVELLPVDARAASEWARLRFQVAESGRRVNINDLWIAAIAVANRMPVITQDDDFDVLVELGGLQVIKV